jgi:hypothetical protein
MVGGTENRAILVSGGQCYDFENIFTKKWWRRFSTKNAASYAQI